MDTIYKKVGIRGRKKNASTEGKCQEVSTQVAKKREVLYAIDESPPWYTCIFFGLQHYLLLTGSSISMPLIATSAMCIDDDEVGKSELICTQILVTGLATLIQTTIGTRLPIVQGPSPAFFSPIFAILALQKWKCPDVPEVYQSIPKDALLPGMNVTYQDWRRDVWTLRMREIQGSIIMAAIFQVLAGCTGLIGFLLRFIGPLTVATTISLIGLSLFSVATTYASTHWGISALTFFLITLFSQYLRNVRLPLPKYTRGKGWSKGWYPVFKLLPVFMSMILVWGLCAILTTTGALSEYKNSTDYGARTDTKSSVLDEALWFRVPYPGQWGRPTFSTAAVLGMLAGVIAGILESVGDYYACARISEAPTPPPHAVNRGVFLEGIGIIIAGLFGTGTGVTSYSENIGAIGITKVASRRVVQVAAIFLIIFGLVAKVGAFLVTIPEPILGGLFLAVFGMISAVGVSNLQFVDLNSSRNLYVFGFSLFFGFALPSWIQEHQESIATGVPTLDQIIVVLLSTRMFVGGFMAMLLDNTIPGTLEERGIISWMNNEQNEDQKLMDRIYGFPFGMDFLRKSRWAKYIPICPPFNPSFLRPKVKEPDREKDRRETVVETGTEPTWEVVWAPAQVSKL